MSNLLAICLFAANCVLAAQRFTFNVDTTEEIVNTKFHEFARAYMEKFCAWYVRIRVGDRVPMPGQILAINCKLIQMNEKAKRDLDLLDSVVNCILTTTRDSPLNKLLKKVCKVDLELLKVYAELFLRTFVHNAFERIIRLFFTPDRIRDGMELCMRYSYRYEPVVNTAFRLLGVEETVRLAQEYNPDRSFHHEIKVYLYMHPEEPRYDETLNAEGTGWMERIRFEPSNRPHYRHRQTEQMSIIAMLNSALKNQLFVMHPHRYLLLFRKELVKDRDALGILVKVLTVAIRVGCFILPIALERNEYTETNDFWDKEVVRYDDLAIRAIKSSAKEIEPFFYFRQADFTKLRGADNLPTIIKNALLNDPKVWMTFVHHCTSDPTAFPLTITSKLVRRPGLMLIRRETESEITVEYGPFVSSGQVAQAILNLRCVKERIELSFGWADGSLDSPFADELPVANNDDPLFEHTTTIKRHYGKIDKQTMMEMHRKQTVEFVQAHREYFDFVRNEARKMRTHFAADTINQS